MKNTTQSILLMTNLERNVLMWLTHEEEEFCVHGKNKDSKSGKVDCTLIQEHLDILLTMLIAMLIL
jgi:hypothetical protein